MILARTKKSSRLFRIALIALFSVFFINKSVFAQRAMYHASNRNMLTSAGTTSAANALDFDGINDYVSLSNSYAATNDLTYETWVYPQFDSGFKSILDHDNWNPGAIHFQFSGSTLQFDVNGGGNNSCTFSFSQNTWYHLAVAYSKTGGYIKFYVNGTLTNTINSGSLPTIAGSQPISMGAWGSGRFFKGTMDDVRIWNVARTQTEIQNNMNSELSGTETGLVAYYAFNQGVAAGDNSAITTVTDKTANALNGTLNNFAKTGATSNFVTGKVSSVSSSVSVTNGLMLNLDAGNLTSYPGSGTTWFDLSGNGNNATLVNSPIYNSSVGGGVFTFNGTNQYVTTSYIPSNTCSISIWFYNNRNYTDYNRGIFSTYKLGGPYDGIYMGTYPSSLNLSRDGNVGWGSSVTPALNINTWYNITVTSKPGVILVYLNGVLKSTINGSTTHADVLNIARTRFDANYWSGYIGTVLVYNKELTSSEVTQNFDSTKTRYGY